ncbi:HlyD family secretion protein [Polaribacter sp. SA4-10]|uniref:HlyD family secretion protein n=1 Tax=Polaribacter sp. SA4-10 TaxID=754397 RepID=UPI000B3C26A0|nr:HlyD family efflux transporter periplasmic adaptor subunit [Polaribacter sp. SA4-10]ARV05782.1 HlyD family secretion protein [Polaribacter sp. SA4-10]
MKYIKIIAVLTIATTTLFSCRKGDHKADGYGNFEATEITVSAESNGKLLSFSIEEGQQLKKEDFVGFIDTITLTLKRQQLVISKSVIGSKYRGVLSQINVLKAQLKIADINKKRTEKLLKDNAGTQKQLDDIIGQMNVIKQQIRSIETQNATVINELKSIDIQLKLIENKIEKSKIINPINGTVLVKYAEPNEIASFAKPLYKIADLSTMRLRVYISETQLYLIKINQEVTVKIDDNEAMKNYKGIITWVSSEAEFTPKIIQTKEERVALVYAAKIDVVNDGSLKIGMPAEMWLSEEN